MKSRVKLVLVIITVLTAAVLVSGFLFYKSMMTPTPDNDHWLSVGQISELKMSKNELDDIKFEGSILFQEESVDKNLEAPEGFVVTKDTLVYKSTSEGRREIANINDLTGGQEVQVWAHFLSDHLVGAYEITILNQ